MEERVDVDAKFLKGLLRWKTVGKLGITLGVASSLVLIAVVWPMHKPEVATIPAALQAAPPTVTAEEELCGMEYLALRKFADSSLDSYSEWKLSWRVKWKDVHEREVMWKKNYPDAKLRARAVELCRAEQIKLVD